MAEWTRHDVAGNISYSCAPSRRGGGGLLVVVEFIIDFEHWTAVIKITERYSLLCGSASENVHVILIVILTLISSYPFPMSMFVCAPQKLSMGGENGFGGTRSKSKRLIADKSPARWTTGYIAPFVRTLAASFRVLLGYCCFCLRILFVLLFWALHILECMYIYTHFFVCSWNWRINY